MGRKRRPAGVGDSARSSRHLAFGTWHSALRIHHAQVVSQLVLGRARLQPCRSGLEFSRALATEGRGITRSQIRISPGLDGCFRLRARDALTTAGQDAGATFSRGPSIPSRSDFLRPQAAANSAGSRAPATEASCARTPQRAPVGFSRCAAAPSALRAATTTVDVGIRPLRWPRKPPGAPGHARSRLRSIENSVTLPEPLERPRPTAVVRRPFPIRDAQA